MPDQPRGLRELVPQAVGAIWTNRWTRVLLIIFFAFEIYNAAVLPAIRGTYDTLRAKDDERTAKANADAANSTLQDLRSAAPVNSQVTTNKDDTQIDREKQWNAYYDCKTVQLRGATVICNKPSVPDPF